MLGAGPGNWLGPKPFKEEPTMTTMLIVGLLALGGLDVDYLDAKKELVEISGHPELVTASATGDYSDHTFNERPKASTFLNKANRRIEDALPELKQEERYQTNIVTGQYTLDIPQLRYVTRIDFQNATYDIKPKSGLRRRTGNEMRQLFPKQFDQYTQGCPRDWCRNSGPLVREFISNGTFDTDVTPWTLVYTSISQGAAPTLTEHDGKARMTFAANSAIVAPRIRYSLNGYPYTVDQQLPPRASDVVPADLSCATIKYDFSTGASEPYVRIYGAGRLVYITQGEQGFPSGTYIYPVLDQALYCASFTGGATPAQVAETVAAAEYIEVGFSTFGASDDPTYADFDNIFLRTDIGLADLIVMPPSDAAYALNVFGGYYSHDFVDDTDETWASVNCPNALVLMAQAYVKLLLEGSKSDFQLFEAQSLQEAQEKWGSLVFEQVKGIPYAEQRFGPISFGDRCAGETQYPNTGTGHYEWVDS